MDQTSPNKSMHICPQCRSGLVYPTIWREAGDDWEVDCRCPNCEWSERGIYTHESVEIFDRVLNQATDKLIDYLTILERENLEASAKLFTEALYQDHILPEDF